MAVLRVCPCLKSTYQSGTSPNLRAAVRYMLSKLTLMHDETQYIYEKRKKPYFEYGRKIRFMFSLMLIQNE